VKTEGGGSWGRGIPYNYQNWGGGKKKRKKGIKQTVLRFGGTRGEKIKGDDHPTPEPLLQKQGGGEVLTIHPRAEGAGAGDKTNSRVGLPIKRKSKNKSHLQPNGEIKLCMKTVASEC